MSENHKKIEDIKHWAMVNRQGVYPSVSFSKVEFDWLVEQAEKVERYTEMKNEIQTILDSPLADWVEIHDAIQDILNKY
jgi:hypothetical protein